MGYSLSSIKMWTPVSPGISFYGIQLTLNSTSDPKEPLLRKWLKLVDEEELDDSFQSLGYGSFFFVINIGSLLLVALYLLLKLLAVCLAKHVEIE